LKIKIAFVSSRELIIHEFTLHLHYCSSEQNLAQHTKRINNWVAVTGYIATRLFSRRACFILKMEKGYIPELEEIGRLAYEKQMMNKMFSQKNLWVQYEPSDSIFGEIKEWFTFGKPIEKLCKGVPVYKVRKVEGEAGGCAKAGILGILGISICGKIDV
uniref:Gastrokine-2 n=1 Tax=Chrysemys picta bellii TaxID=8478 RepID=A0A8C3H6U0_CHRPI